MKALSAVDLHFLVKELQYMVGSKLDKVFQFGTDEFYLSFHTPGQGKSYLYIGLPSMLLRTQQKHSSTTKPPGFCTFLRKYLGGARIKAFEQVGSERILKIVFDAKTGLLVFYIELFSKGNILLTRQDGTIISALFTKRWSQRDIRGGVEYKLPESKGNAFTLDEKAFIKRLKESKKDVVVKAVSTLGIGSGYSEELCVRAGLDKNLPLEKLTPKPSKELFMQYQKMLKAKMQPTAYSKDGKLKDVTPIAFESLQDLEQKSYETFYEALEDHYATNIVEEKKTVAQTKQSKEVLSLQKSMEAQAANAKKLVKDALAAEAAGNFIYEHYANVKDVIEQTKQALQELDDKELKKKLKGHKVIKQVDRKEKTVTVEL